VKKLLYVKGGLRIGNFGLLVGFPVVSNGFSNPTPFWKGILKSYQISFNSFVHYSKWRRNPRWQVFNFYQF
jgi:hypothetical protein